MKARAMLAALAFVAACGGAPPAAHDEHAPAGPHPLSDMDFDHILDTQDRCPDQAEDVDGFEDTDGCPDTDNDGDGIADAADLCPDAWEDCDGFEDSDGCADPDNDRDRIPDACDKCPNDPETYNGFEDGDGCPDRAYIVVTSSQIVILEHIYFPKNDSTIQPLSAPVLDALAATLLGNPQIELVAIVGHGETAEAGVHRLAQRRAEAVRDALVQRGVDTHRIDVHESGSSQPVAPNTTAQNRALNRRVEFLIMRIGGTDVMTWNGTQLVPVAPPPAPPPPPPPIVPPYAEIDPACADGRVPPTPRPPHGGCAAAAAAAAAGNAPPPALPPLPPLVDGGLVMSGPVYDLRGDGGVADAAPLPTSIVPPELSSGRPSPL